MMASILCLAEKNSVGTLAILTDSVIGWRLDPFFVILFRFLLFGGSWFYNRSRFWILDIGRHSS